MKGWLVNDTLTCIPGTRTLWHELLDWFPLLQDKTNGHTPFNLLTKKIEREASLEPPDYIIRNGTFFPKIKVPVKTISLIQDIYHNEIRTNQIDVINNSDLVVFNSNYTKTHYQNDIKVPSVIIPLGIDFDFFTPSNNKYNNLNILPNSIVFVGAANNHPKGFDILLDFINNSNYNFCLVMKDDFKIDHPRVKVFNKVGHDVLLEIYRSCKVCICTSRVETQHLASIEAGACNIPVVTSNIGAYYNRPSGEWGHVFSSSTELALLIETVFKNYKDYAPRDYFLNSGFSKNSCKYSWKVIIDNL